MSKVNKDQDREAKKTLLRVWENRDAELKKQIVSLHPEFAADNPALLHEASTRSKVGDAGYLLGRSDSGKILLGIVLPPKSSGSKQKIAKAVRFIATNRQLLLQGFEHVDESNKPTVALWVFRAPDLGGECKTPIDGTEVEYFLWTPRNESEISTEKQEHPEHKPPKSKGVSGAADESRVQPILDHLAWLQFQTAAKINHDRVAACAWLTYSAAVLLQWRYVLPMSAEDTLDDTPERTKAAKIIDDYVQGARDIVNKSRKADQANNERLRSNCRDFLQKLTGTLLKKLPKLYSFPAPKPVRCPAVDRQPKVSELIDEWLNKQIADGKLDHAALDRRADEMRAADDAGEYGTKPFVKSLGMLIFATESPVIQNLDQKAREEIRRMAADTFNTEVEIRSHKLGTLEARRWKQLAKEISLATATRTPI